MATPGTPVATPAFRLSLAGAVVDTVASPRSSTVVSLAVTASVDVPVAEAVIVLGRAGGPAVAVGDVVQVELGYADTALTPVLAGTVVRIEGGLSSTRVHVQDGGRALLRSYGDRTYQSMTAGAIARDLAGLAGVPAGSIEDGVTFPAYVVDGRRSAARHLRDLAALCGFDVYLDSGGRLAFLRWAGGATAHVYEYGKHPLAGALVGGEPSAGAVAAFGESPGYSRGTEAWAWLTKDFSPRAGSAGSGAPTALLERPVLRTPEAAQAAASAHATALVRSAIVGEVTGVGRPEVRLGDAVTLRGVPAGPGGSPDGTYQVRAVTHRVGKAGGFTTSVVFRSQAQAGG